MFSKGIVKINLISQKHIILLIFILIGKEVENGLESNERSGIIFKNQLSFLSIFKLMKMQYV